MENQRNPEQSQENENWLDSVLPAQPEAVELGLDEQAVFSHDLKHPKDMNMTQILEEAKFLSDEPFPASDESYHEAYTGTVQESAPEDIDGDVLSSIQEAFGEAPVAGDGEAFYEQDPYYEEEEYYEDEPEPQRKRRPLRKGGYGLLGLPHLFATIIWLAIIIAIGVSLGRVLWVCVADMLAFGRENKEIVFTIEDDEDLDTIAENLREAGLITYPELFKMFVDLKDAEEEIVPGTFTLNTIYDYNALVNSLSPYAEGRAIVEVTIPEGYTCAQIFALLEENGVCTVAELEAWAADGELSDWWFLEGVDRGHKYCLEGYLFPDTYQFYTNDDPENVLNKILEGFDYRFTDKMRENFTIMQQTYADLMTQNGYDEAYVAEHALTIHDLVTIASMVEKETAGGSDSYKIASVIYNRLVSPEFTVLQVDATVVYALGGKTDPLTYSDLEIDSPYNTYMYEGLPVGPISNPGRHSLYAALEPYQKDEEGTDYYSIYYYVYDPSENEHIYAETYEEHKWNIASLED